MHGNLGCSCGGRAQGLREARDSTPLLIVGSVCWHLLLGRLYTESSTSTILGGGHIPIILLLLCKKNWSSVM